MNTSQIWTALKSDPVTGKKFLGVFPADRLPKEIESYPKGFIANTDVSGKRGTHWVAFYFPSEGKAEFFDSYGQPPERYHKFFRDYLKHYDWDLINVNCKVSGRMYVDNIVYFTSAIECEDIA